MGQTHRRPLPLSFEDASGRLSREEERRLEASWARWRSPGSKDSLGRRPFREAVLSATFVPDSVADQLFAAFVPRGRDGLSYRDLIIAIVVLTKSTRDERHKFLFYVFSDDGEVVVTGKLLERLRMSGETVPKTLASAIASVEKLSAEEFRGWVERVRGDIPLAAWLLDSPPSLSCHEPLPNFYQSLAGITHLEEAEVLELDKLYWSLADSKTRRLDAERFAALVSPPLPPSLVPGLFAAFDENADGQIDLKELVCGLSASARGPSAERAKFAFKIFDRDRAGRLGRAEVEDMLEQLLQLCPSSTLPGPNALATSLLGPSSSLSLQDFLLAPLPQPLLQSLLDLLHQIAHVVLGLTPQDKATEANIVKSWHLRSISHGRLEEGQLWYLICSKWWNNWERWTSMTLPCSPGLSQSSRMRADSNVEYSGGEEAVKFVPAATPSVSSEGSLPPTPPPPHRPLRPPSEAGSSSGSSRHPGSSPAPSAPSPAPSAPASPRRRLSFGARRSWSPCPRIVPGGLAEPAALTVATAPVKPPPIDNRPLLDTEKHPWSKLNSLSSEGGLLRRDILEGKDYVRVPEPLWSALCRWYGGGYDSPPLPRKVIISATKELELELYPVTLTIVRHEVRGSGSGSHGPGRGLSTGSAFTYAVSATAAAVQRGLAEAAREWQVSDGAPRRVPLHRISLSRTARLGELASALQAVPALRLSSDNYRLWLLTHEAGKDLDDPDLDLMLLEEEELPLQELAIKTGSRVLLEVRNKDLTWPEELSRLAKSLGSGDANALRAPNTGPVPKGVTGLYNLGSLSLVQELAIKTGSRVLLEVRNKDLTWPEELSRLAKSLGSGDANALRAPNTGPVPKGVTGLYNLGSLSLVQELAIKTGSRVLLEVRNKDLTWPEELSRLAKSLGSGDANALRAPNTGPVPKGVTGLYNLGSLSLVQELAIKTGSRVLLEVRNKDLTWPEELSRLAKSLGSGDANALRAPNTGPVPKGVTGLYNLGSLSLVQELAIKTGSRVLLEVRNKDLTWPEELSRLAKSLGSGDANALRAPNTGPVPKGVTGLYNLGSLSLVQELAIKTGSRVLLEVRNKDLTWPEELSRLAKSLGSGDANALRAPNTGPVPKGVTGLYNLGSLSLVQELAIKTGSRVLLEVRNKDLTWPEELSRLAKSLGSGDANALRAPNTGPVPKGVTGLYNLGSLSLVQELAIKTGSRVLLEVRNKDLTWPEELSRLAKSLGSGDANALRAPNTGPVPKGVTGLYNLGSLSLVQELAIKTGSRVLLEVRNKDLTWPEELSRLAKSLGSGDANALRAPNTGPVPKGVTGLYNLGSLSLVQELAIKTGSRVLLEVRNKDLTWPEELSRLAKSLGSEDANALRAPNTGPVPKGVTGLYNLGSLSLVQELAIKTGLRVLLEVRNKDLTWPEELSRLAKSLGSGDANALRAPNTGPVPKGVTGLYNLGNTCYMNSAIQCVSNTNPLTLYFQKGLHRAELNRENALGMKGNIALVYGELVRELWSAQSKFIAPIKLKVTVAKYAQRFDDLNQHDCQGNIALVYGELVRELWSAQSKFIAPIKLKVTVAKYAQRFDDLNQHDCQELLAFLLDGLHEDLNRVTRKPYTELKDSAGRSDALVAAEAWDNHLKRNQSILVDLFHGLLRSQVECETCCNVSTRFDPFTFLSLPLPLDENLLLSAVLVPLDGTRPLQLGLRLPPGDTVTQLGAAIAKAAGLSHQNLLLVELAHSGVLLRCLAQDQSIRRLACTSNTCLLFAFEIPPKPEQATTIPNGVLASGVPAPAKPANASRPKPPSHSRTESNVSATSVRSEVGEGEPIPGPSAGFVLGVNRKLEQQDTYFLAHQRARPVIFGLPIVLPAGEDGAWTGEGLYEAAWTAVSRLVLPASKAGPGLPNNHALDGDRDPAGPAFPFRLCLTNREGTRCAVCPWFRLCLGCPIPPSGPVSLGPGVFVGIDWDLNALHLRYQHSQEMVWTVDDSVAAAAEAHCSPVTLASCLQSFTEEETLGSTDPVYCSKCKTQCPVKKRLAIWKLPPILVVHLKRFQFVGNRWVKSTKMVSFPKEGFNPSSFMASMQEATPEVPEVTANGPVKEEPKEPQGATGTSEPAAAPLRRNTDETKGTVVVGEERSSADIDLLVEEGEAVKREETGSPVRKLLSSVRKSGGREDKAITLANPAYEPRDRKASTASSLAPMLEPNDHRLRADADPLSLDYDLYAIACHYGVLGAGHYVCYAKHTNDSWYLYNDSKVKAVEEDEVDGNMAYLLFYQRRGLDASAYLPPCPPDAIPSPLPNGVPANSGDNDTDSKHCQLM